MKRILIIAIIAVLAIAGAAYYYFFIAASKDAEVIIPYSPGEYFITNIQDSSRLLKTTIVLGLKGEELVTSFTDNNHKVRDTIIFILRELTEDEVRDVGVEKLIRDRIREALNETMQTDGVTDVWFNDFVMQ